MATEKYAKMRHEARQQAVATAIEEMATAIKQIQKTQTIILDLLKKPVPEEEETDAKAKSKTR